MKNSLILSLLSTATSATTLNLKQHNTDKQLGSEDAAYMDLWNELASIEEAEE